jgi:hypothetical protein
MLGGKIMKKLTALLLSLALVLSAACGETQPASDNNDVTREQHTTAEADKITEPPFEGTLVETQNFSIWVMDGWKYEWDEKEPNYFSINNSAAAHAKIEIISIAEMSREEVLNFTADSTPAEILEAFHSFYTDIELSSEYTIINGADALKMTIDFPLFIMYIFVDKVNIYMIELELHHGDDVLADLDFMARTFMFNLNAVAVPERRASQKALDYQAETIYALLSIIVEDRDSQGEVMLLDDYVLISDGGTWSAEGSHNEIAAQLNIFRSAWTEATVMVKVGGMGQVLEVIYTEDNEKFGVFRAY